ncbi:MAG: VOC family protein [Planctomycetota bacterium]
MSDSHPAVQGFHHAAIRAHDFDASVAFYTDVLGLTPKLAWGPAGNRAIMLDAGKGDYLEIFERPDAPTTPTEPEPPLLHIAFRTNALEATLEAARAAGMEVTMERNDVDIANTHAAGGLPAVVPVRIAFFRGPDGELVELFENALT